MRCCRAAVLSSDSSPLCAPSSVSRRRNAMLPSRRPLLGGVSGRWVQDPLCPTGTGRCKNHVCSASCARLQYPCSTEFASVCARRDADWIQTHTTRWQYHDHGILASVDGRPFVEDVEEQIMAAVTEARSAASQSYPSVYRG